MSENEKDSNLKSNGKGRPTPSRKEREAANRKPLVGDRSKEGMAAARAKEAIRRKEARAAMLAGDERYLLARERGPQRKLVRDFLDYRFTFVEGLLPMMIVFMLFAEFLGRAQQQFTTYIMFFVIAICLLEVTLYNSMARKIIRKNLGQSQVIQRGTWLYILMRAIQPRPLRVPKPGPRKLGNK